jgi:GNAT superfamily N-acetyltransferase
MRASIRGLARSHYGPREIAAWSSLPALYHAWAMTAGGERYVVAERGGAIVGYAAVRAAEVSALFVRPGAARRGIGAALLARVERGARRRGVRRLRVDAALPAIAFYVSRGFRGGRALRVPLPGGEALPARRLSKRL